MFKTIPQNVKLTLSSSAPLAGVLILFLFVGNFGISKITSIRNQINEASREQKMLTQKLKILQTVNIAFENQPDLATNALPNVNSALLTISQLKNLALANSVIISGLKAGTEVKDETGLSRVDVAFEVSGTRTQIVDFLKAISTIAPIAIVDSIKLNEGGGVARGAVSVKSFWFPLPAILSSVTQPLSELTEDEKDVIFSIGSLKQPPFLALPPPVSGGKSDPFNF